MSLLLGCAASPRLNDSTLNNLPPGDLLKEVPFYAQRDYQCGPASLAMVLNAAGVNVEMENLIPQVFIPGRKGSVQSEMLATVRRHGMIPFPIEGSLDALLTQLASGQPVVVLQNLALPVWPMWHYAVAIGYDLPTRTLTLHSGEISNHEMSLSRFDATWARSERWGFTIMSPGSVPEAIRPFRAIEAISTFESVQGVQAALPSWKALVNTHPDSAMGHFALGNAHYAVGEIKKSRQALEQAVLLDESLGVAWLNLGLIERQLNNDVEARRALSRAAALTGPWQTKAQETLNTL
ncbi:PA2778 family cysteine peptidase [Vreelandella rituensis]|nr:PA2778 family cysteine peptidase [Halomonas rituensis]